MNPIELLGTAATLFAGPALTDWLKSSWPRLKGLSVPINASVCIALHLLGWWFLADADRAQLTDYLSAALLAAVAGSTARAVQERREAGPPAPRRSRARR